MSEDSEDKLRDLVVWYFENRTRIPRDNLAKRLDFMDKAMKCALEIIAMQLKDIQTLEQRHGRPKLWLPTSVKIGEHESVKLRD